MVYLFRILFIILMIYLGTLWEGKPMVGVAIAAVVIVIEQFIFEKFLQQIYPIFFGFIFGLLFSGALLKCMQMVLGIISPTYELPKPMMMMTVLVLSYFGVVVALKYLARFKVVLPFVQMNREMVGSATVLLDTSILIDGRILEICETRFLQGKMLVPIFVLEETQRLADSSDKIKRNRGRRGLDVLGRLRGNRFVDLEFIEERREKGEDTDGALLRLSKSMNSRLMTTDFNLTKRAKAEGLQVTNLNDLTVALKPHYIPGEKIAIQIVKPGESDKQGVGFLADGTMVVVEQAGPQMGKIVEAIVTSAIQTAAGKMLFARLLRDREKVGAAEEISGNQASHGHDDHS